MLRTRRLRNALRAGAPTTGRTSHGDLSDGIAHPVIVARAVHRIEDLTSDLDLGGWPSAAAMADDAPDVVRDD